jgi:hypothetical protein
MFPLGRLSPTVQKEMPKRIPPASLLRENNKEKKMPKKTGSALRKGVSKPRNGEINCVKKYSKGTENRIQYLYLPILFE